MKEKSLLRRYRWPLFILMWGSGQFAGTMFLYGRPGDALYGFIAALGVGTICVVLEMIDGKIFSIFVRSINSLMFTFPLTTRALR